MRWTSSEGSFITSRLAPRPDANKAHGLPASAPPLGSAWRRRLGRVLQQAPIGRLVGGDEGVAAEALLDRAAALRRVDLVDVARRFDHLVGGLDDEALSLIHISEPTRLGMIS